MSAAVFLEVPRRMDLIASNQDFRDSQRHSNEVEHKNSKRLLHELKLQTCHERFKRYDKCDSKQEDRHRQSADKSARLPWRAFSVDS